jgi:hypothetical protein
MKASAVLLFLLAVSLFVLPVGCQEEAKPPAGPDPRQVNIELMNAFNDIAMQNAIIAQHTLYPYHFINNSARLNELGQRDLDVLAGHFAENPGRLNIRMDGLAADLYRARIDTVTERLAAAGVDMDRVSVSDGMPGGDGMVSERVLIILKKEYVAPAVQTRTRTGTTGASSRAR